jgi:hypothetical protein
MMRSGIAYQLPPSAPLTDATASGSWPTPIRSDSRGSSGQPKKNKQVQLVDAVKMWPTPTSSLGTKGARIMPRQSREGVTLIEAVRLSEQIGGSLNPTWVEWLMGFPLGWTALEHWATRSSLRSQKSSVAP